MSGKQKYRSLVKATEETKEESRGAGGLRDGGEEKAEHGH